MSSHHLPAAWNPVPPSGAEDSLPPECHEVLRSLWDYLDGNCAPDVATRLAEHLTSCGPCFRLRQFQERFFAALLQMQERLHAPAHLRRRLAEALAAERVSQR